MLHVNFAPDPPAGVPTKAERVEFAEILKDRRGSMALLARSPGRRSSTLYTYAWLIRRAEKNMDMFGPAGAFEAVAVTLFNETHLYVRYVGKEEGSMYQLTRILPDDTIRPHKPVASVRDVLMTTASGLIDADIEPRLARRFALHLTRQPLGTEVRHEPTGWRFRIDELKENEQVEH